MFCCKSSSLIGSLIVLHDICQLVSEIEVNSERIIILSLSPSLPPSLPPPPLSLSLPPPASLSPSLPPPSLSLSLFLFHCTKYEYIHKQFIAKQSQILNFTSFDDYKKICYILFTTSNKTSIHCTAKYISKCLLLRDK